LTFCRNCQGSFDGETAALFIFDVCALEGGHLVDLAAEFWSRNPLPRVSGKRSAKSSLVTKTTNFLPPALIVVSNILPMFFLELILEEVGTFNIIGRRAHESTVGRVVICYCCLF
jgi:hypothetical protein